MKRLFVFLLAFVIIFSILPTNQTYAANEDFDVAYNFSPELVGSKGADVHLTLTIRNTGSTNITWIDVVINTTTTYYQRWTGTITPGSTRRLSYIVPFESSDLEKNKILQVSMNNDMDTNNDGVKMFNFEIHGTEYIFDVDVSKTPDRSEYRPGDMIHIAHDFTNLFESHAATEVITTTYMARAGDHVCDNISIYHGSVFPGSTITDEFTYVFSEDDTGHIEVFYRIQYIMMGKEYMREAVTMEFDVLPPYIIDMHTDLTATPTEIDSGDTVTFQLYILNTGSDIDRIEVRNGEGGIVAFIESLAAGASGTIPLSVNIHENCDVSYVVVAYIGEDHLSVETNNVYITVRDPVTATPDEILISTPTPTINNPPSPDATPDNTEVIGSLEPTNEVMESIVSVDGSNKDYSGINLAFLLVLLIVVLLILVGLVVLLVYLRRKH